MKKETGFQWGDNQEKSFQKLKDACVKEPVLLNFRANKPMKIKMDASDQAVGTCLYQRKDGKWHPVAYYSRKMSQAEQNYNIHDKELLAVVNALEHWRVYAESSSELTIFMDHKNLTTFTTTKKLNQRQVRWAELLGQHKFKILYTPGKDNGRADALSRRKDHMDKDECEGTILQQDLDGNLVPRTQLNELSAHMTEEMIQNYHDNPAHGHPGISKIVNRFTKYLITVPFKETHTAEQLGHLLLDRLVRDHGVPITIITDRDKLFMSNYWKTISAAMGTKPKMSTAYHPQMDGQTE